MPPVRPVPDAGVLDLQALPFRSCRAGFGQGVRPVKIDQDIATMAANARTVKRMVT